MKKLYYIFIKRFVFPVYDIIKKSNISGYLRYLKENKKLNYHDMKEIQRDKLKGVLDNAHKNISSYKDLEYKEDPYEFVKEFPVIRRDDVIEEDSKYLMENYNKKGHYHLSGGSTGLNAKIYLSNREYSCSQATQLFWLESIGYKYGDRIIQVGIKTRKRDKTKSIKDFLLNTDYIYYFEISKEEKIECLKRNSKYEKVFFLGFPNLALEIMDLTIENDLDLRFSGILSYGEKLTEEAHDRLKSFYDCKVLNTYGCAEGVLAAYGLNTDNMDIMMENTYIEIVDDKFKPVENGSKGNILITNLNAFNMPLIRYHIKDIGTVKIGGDRRDKLVSIDGRDNDYLYTPEGGKYHLFTVSGDSNFIKYKVKQFQWHQKELDYIQIKYVPSSYGLLTDEDKEDYTELVRRKLNSPKMKFDYIAVDELTRYRSGKVQRVINDLSLQDP